MTFSTKVLLLNKLKNIFTKYFMWRNVNFYRKKCLLLRWQAKPILIYMAFNAKTNEKKIHTKWKQFHIHFRRKISIPTNLSNLLASISSAWIFVRYFGAFKMLLLLLNVERIIPFQKTNQGREIARVKTDDTR